MAFVFILVGTLKMIWRLFTSHWVVYLESSRNTENHLRHFILMVANGSEERSF